MRENIGLFKAKDIETRDWREGCLIIDGTPNARKYYIQTIPSKTNPLSDIYEVDPETLCECTGLKDKNGKLIWENDIVNKKYDDWECNCEVVFGNYSIGRDDWGIEHITQGFALKFDDGSGYCGLGEKNKYEVIGNKFEEVESE